MSDVVQRGGAISFTINGESLSFPDEFGAALSAASKGNAAATVEEIIKILPPEEVNEYRARVNTAFSSASGSSSSIIPTPAGAPRPAPAIVPAPVVVSGSAVAPGSTVGAPAPAMTPSSTVAPSSTVGAPAPAMVSSSAVATSPAPPPVSISTAPSTPAPSTSAPAPAPSRPPATPMTPQLELRTAIEDMVSAYKIYGTITSEYMLEDLSRRKSTTLLSRLVRTIVLLNMLGWHERGTLETLTLGSSNCMTFYEKNKAYLLRTTFDEKAWGLASKAGITASARSIQNRTNVYNALKAAVVAGYEEYCESIEYTPITTDITGLEENIYFSDGNSADVRTTVPHPVIGHFPAARAPGPDTTTTPIYGYKYTLVHGWFQKFNANKKRIYTLLKREYPALPFPVTPGTSLAYELEMATVVKGLEVIKQKFNAKRTEIDRTLSEPSKFIAIKTAIIEACNTIDTPILSIRTALATDPISFEGFTLSNANVDYTYLYLYSKAMLAANPTDKFALYIEAFFTYFEVLQYIIYNSIHTDRIRVVFLTGTLDTDAEKIAEGEKQLPGFREGAETAKKAYETVSAAIVSTAAKKASAITDADTKEDGAAQGQVRASGEAINKEKAENDRLNTVRTDNHIDVIEESELQKAATLWNTFAIMYKEDTESILSESDDAAKATKKTNLIGPAYKTGPPRKGTKGRTTREKEWYEELVNATVKANKRDTAEVQSATAQVRAAEAAIAAATAGINAISPPPSTTRLLTLANAWKTAADAYKQQAIVISLLDSLTERSDGYDGLIAGGGLKARCKSAAAAHKAVDDLFKPKENTYFDDNQSGYRVALKTKTYTPQSGVLEYAILSGRSAATNGILTKKYFIDIDASDDNHEPTGKLTNYWKKATDVNIGTYKTAAANPATNIGSTNFSGGARRTRRRSTTNKRKSTKRSSRTKNPGI